MISNFLSPKVLMALGLVALLGASIHVFIQNNRLTNLSKNQADKINLLRSDSVSLSSSIVTLKSENSRLREDSLKFESRLTNLKLTWYENNERLKIRIDSTIKANRNNGGNSGRNAVLNLIKEHGTGI